MKKILILIFLSLNTLAVVAQISNEQFLNQVIKDIVPKEFSKFYLVKEYKQNRNWLNSLGKTNATRPLNIWFSINNAKRPEIFDSASTLKLQTWQPTINNAIIISKDSATDLLQDRVAVKGHWWYTEKMYFNKYNRAKAKAVSARATLPAFKKITFTINEPYALANGKFCLVHVKENYDNGKNMDIIYVFEYIDKAWVKVDALK